LRSFVKISWTNIIFSFAPKIFCKFRLNIVVCIYFTSWGLFAPVLLLPVIFNMIMRILLVTALALVGFSLHAEKFNPHKAAHLLPTEGTLDFTPNGTQPGLLRPLEGNEACSNCHDGSSPGDSSQLPFPTWSGSMMANAARDPLFWAALDVANRDVPGIGDYCIRCHAPSAWLAGRVRKDGQGGFVNGTNGCQMLGDQDDFDGKANDYAGIGCHFCHRTMETGPTGQSPLIFNANIWIDDSLNCTVDGQSNNTTCRRGPYRYPDRTALGTQSASPPHAWKQDNYYKAGAYCGSCHDVSSPDTNNGPLKTLILNDGTNTNRAFPLDRTYSEWKASEYASAFFRDGLEINGPSAGETFGETCQSCHMRTSQSATARACIQTSAGTRKGQLPVHEFAGSNAFMVSVIKSLYGENLGRNAAFDRTLAWIRDNLQNRSATIGVATQPLLASATTLNASVRVTNLTGHKLPAGYAEGRRMWINLIARDASGTLIFESGAYNPATAVLSEDAQIKIYETTQGVWQRFGNTGVCVTKENITNRKLFNLALNNCIAKDNRIPPLGFSGGNNVEIRPVAYTYPETSPGSGKLVNFDVTPYAIPIPANAVRPITVQATLKHQVLSKAYADFLRDEAVNGNFQTEDQMCNRTSDVGPANKTRGQFMFDAWTNNGKSTPENMVSASVVSVASVVDAK
jgi:hypothetical protein